MTQQEGVRTVLAALNIVFDTTAVLLIGWSVTRIIRRSSSIRHAVWVAVFATLLLLPILGQIHPAHRTVSIQIPMPVEAAKQLHEVAPISDSIPAISPLQAAELSAPISFHPLVEHKSTPDWPLIARLCLLVWAAGAALLLSWMLFAIHGVWSLYRSSVSVAWREGEFELLSKRLRIRRSIQLRVAQGDFPISAMTWGTLRPVVLLPLSSSDWSDDQRELILMHELAHVKRCDSLSQLLAALASAVFWFHPIVWLASFSMRAEAESAADDSVIQCGIRATDYATNLVAIANRLGAARLPRISLGVFMIKRSRIEQRIRSIIDPDRRRRGATLTQAVAIGTVAVLVVYILANLRPIAATGPDIRESLFDDAMYNATRHQREKPRLAAQTPPVKTARSASGVTIPLEDEGPVMGIAASKVARLRSRVPVLPTALTKHDSCIERSHDRSYPVKKKQSASQDVEHPMVVEPVQQTESPRNEGEQLNRQIMAAISPSLRGARLMMVNEQERAQKILAEVDAQSYAVPIPVVRRVEDAESRPEDLEEREIRARNTKLVALFHAIEIGPAIQLVLEIGHARTCSIECKSDPKTDLSGNISAGVLHLRGAGSMVVAIKVPQLDGINVDGNSNVRITGIAEKHLKLVVAGNSVVHVTGTAHDYQIDLSGSGSLVCDGVEANTFRAAVSGGSSFDLKGRGVETILALDGGCSVAASGFAKHLTVMANGGSSADLSKLPTQSAVTHTDGASKIIINVTGSLIAKAEHGSQIVYAGNPPHVISTPDGSSTISK